MLQQHQRRGHVLYLQQAVYHMGRLPRTRCQTRPSELVPLSCSVNMLTSWSPGDSVCRKSRLSGKPMLVSRTLNVTYPALAWRPMWMSPGRPSEKAYFRALARSSFRIRPLDHGVDDRGRPQELTLQWPPIHIQVHGLGQVPLGGGRDLPFQPCPVTRQAYGEFSSTHGLQAIKDCVEIKWSLAGKTVGFPPGAGSTVCLRKATGLRFCAGVTASLHGHAPRL